MTGRVTIRKPQRIAAEVPGLAADAARAGTGAEPEVAAAAAGTRV